jgi:hypothetical protein
LIRNAGSEKVENTRLTEQISELDIDGVEFWNTAKMPGNGNRTHFRRSVPRILYCASKYNCSETRAGANYSLKAGVALGVRKQRSLDYYQAYNNDIKHCEFDEYFVENTMKQRLIKFRETLFKARNSDYYRKYWKLFQQILCSTLILKYEPYTMDNPRKT